MTTPQLPPHDRLAELTVIQCLLIAPELVPDVLDIIGPADMYHPPHETILEAMRSLTARGMAVDSLTVEAELKAAGRWASDIATTMAEMPHTIPNTRHAEQYARIVRERSLLRRFIVAARGQVERAYEQAGDVEAFLGDAETAILKATDAESAAVTCRSIGELASELYASTQAASQQGERIRGVESGLIDLDAMTHGFYPGELVVIAGRPAMGKSALAGAISMRVAASTQRAVIVHSLEMRGSTWATRAVASATSIEASRVRQGDIAPREWGMFAAAAAAFEKVPLFVDDAGSVSVARVRARALRKRREHGLALIVVDYLQLMSGSKRHGNREGEVAEISRGLKSLAMELEVAVVALSQLNRQLEQRPNKRPLLSDLRESGAIEQDADKVIFVYRDEVYDPDLNRGVAELILAKQRSGSTGTVLVGFDGKHLRFSNRDRAVSHEPHPADAPHWTEEFHDA